MENLYVFFIRNDVLIYIICGLALFWYISRLLYARQLLRQARFTIEREKGHRLRANALFFVLLFAGVAGSVIYVNREIAPTLSPELLKPPTLTPNPFLQPLSSPTPDRPRTTPRPIATPTSPLAPTITLPNINSGGLLQSTPTNSAVENAGTTPSPNSSSTPTAESIASNCPSNINLSEPLAGSTVTGLTSFSGTVTATDFQFYKLEISGPQTSGAWTDLLGRSIYQQVSNGFLGSANLDGWQTGNYFIRLLVTDNNNGTVGACVIEILLP